MSVCFESRALNDISSEKSTSGCLSRDTVQRQRERERREGERQSDKERDRESTPGAFESHTSDASTRHTSPEIQTASLLKQ